MRRPHDAPSAALDERRMMTLMLRSPLLPERPTLAAAASLAMCLAACGAHDDLADANAGNGAELASDLAHDDSAHDELGQSAQALWGLRYNEPSCYDPTGTDSVLAALAVATATELRRWAPTQDFYVSAGVLRLSSTGKKRCADGMCLNTQALLDMQRSSSPIEIRPGVKVSPTVLKYRLAYNHEQQMRCTYSWWNRCTAPSHEFRLLHSEPGACDTNYWFEVVDLQGNPLHAGLEQLEDKLIWVDVEDNSYIRFEASGSTVRIDPTAGLNETGATRSGSCSASCAKVSRTSLVGQCCSCNGMRRYQRSPFSANMYVCK